jgi:quinol monooxygenase YgiN
MSNTYVTLVAEFSAKPGKEEALKAALMGLVEPTRKEEGCIQYDLHVNSKEPGSFLFFENWASGEALAKHGQSEHLKAFGASVAELLGGAPKLTTYTRIA